MSTTYPSKLVFRSCGSTCNSTSLRALTLAYPGPMPCEKGMRSVSLMLAAINRRGNSGSPFVPCAKGGQGRTNH